MLPVGAQAVKRNLQQEPLQQLLEEVKSVLDDDTQVCVKPFTCQACAKAMPQLCQRAVSQDAVASLLIASTAAGKQGSFCKQGTAVLCCEGPG